MLLHPNSLILKKLKITGGKLYGTFIDFKAVFHVDSKRCKGQDVRHDPNNLQDNRKLSYNGGRDIG